MDNKTKEQWAAVFGSMIDEYRAGNPDDPRSDLELLYSLMDHFVESGLVEKKDGKYGLPKIVFDS